MGRRRRIIWRKQRCPTSRRLAEVFRDWFRTRYSRKVGPIKEDEPKNEDNWWW